MPDEQEITKAVLQEIGWTDDWEPKEMPDGKEVTVQFNPQSLKVSFANQKAGGDQKGGGAIQFVGTGTTKLSLDLLFDVTAPLGADGAMEPHGDARYLTQDVAHFIKPVNKAKTKKKKKDEADKYIPPGVRFIWGSFIFEGVIDSINETLELFSNKGKPLRATISISLSRQDIFFPRLPETGGAGTESLTEAQEGDTMQSIAAREGSSDDWQDMAAANNVENPRQVEPGTQLTAPT